MIHITLILAIVMASFGVFRQSVMFPYNDWHWQLVRDIFYKPYFMLYGEVYAGEIDSKLKTIALTRLRISPVIEIVISC